MPRTALRCLVEINLRAITCPGVWLPRRDDIYLSVRLFNETRTTQLSSPIFPLLFHETFRFDRVFYTAFEPSQVADALEDCQILVELIQMSALYAGGRLLASYETNARDFLYPYPSYSTTYGTQDREVLLNRTLDFPGISPKLEFSTRTVLRETHVPLTDFYDYDLDLYSGRTSRGSGRRSRSRSRSRNRTIGFSRPTISSISRARSMSPSLRRSMSALELDDSPTLDDIKPPFVVRKVEKDLIGRTPGGPGADCAHSLNYSLKKRPYSSGHYTGYSYDDSYLYDYYRPSSRISQVIREPGRAAYPLYSPRYPYFSDADSDDLEVARLTSASYDPYYSRPRTASPLLYRSSLSDRYDERPWSLARSDLISRHVERALSRNRSLDRLSGRLSPYSDCYLTSKDYLSDLALDLELASPASTKDSDFWAKKTALYDGKHHRDSFNQGLQKTYSQMYQQAAENTAIITCS